ncbi:hypothetical protein Tco_0291095 [Tanacetum coccineum]
MMTYLKHVGGKKHADLKNKNFKEIQVLYKEVKRSDKNFIAIGSAEDGRQIKEMNEESKDPKKKRLKKRVVNETLREEDTAKVPVEQEVQSRDKKRKNNHRYEIMEQNLLVSKLHNVSSPDGDYLFVTELKGDLKIMIESLTEENDQELKDGTVIYMLVERSLNPNSNGKREVFSLRDWHGLVGDYNQFKTLLPMQADTQKIK